MNTIWKENILESKFKIVLAAKIKVNIPYKQTLFKELYLSHKVVYRGPFMSNCWNGRAKNTIKKYTFQVKIDRSNTCPLLQPLPVGNWKNPGLNKIIQWLKSIKAGQLKMSVKPQCYVVPVWGGFREQVNSRALGTPPSGWAQCWQKLKNCAANKSKAASRNLPCIQPEEQRKRD